MTLDEALSKVTSGGVAACLAACTIAFNYWIWNHPRALLKQDLEMLKLAKELDVAGESDVRFAAEKGIRRVYGAGAFAAFLNRAFAWNFVVATYYVVKLVRDVQGHRTGSIVINVAILFIYAVCAFGLLGFRRKSHVGLALDAMHERLRKEQRLVLDMQEETDLRLKEVTARERELRIEIAALTASNVVSPAQSARLDTEASLFQQELKVLKESRLYDSAKPLKEQSKYVRAFVQANETAAGVARLRAEMKWRLPFARHPVVDWGPVPVPAILLPQSSDGASGGPPVLAHDVPPVAASQQGDPELPLEVHSSESENQAPSGSTIDRSGNQG
ncbi:MAG: hypothetical protein ACHREM_06435 [Polyangiales bacterium]